MRLLLVRAPLRSELGCGSVLSAGCGLGGAGAAAQRVLADGPLTSLETSCLLHII